MSMQRAFDPSTLRPFDRLRATQAQGNAGSVRCRKRDSRSGDIVVSRSEEIVELTMLCLPDLM